MNHIGLAVGSETVVTKQVFEATVVAIGTRRARGGGRHALLPRHDIPPCRAYARRAESAVGGLPVE